MGNVETDLTDIFNGDTNEETDNVCLINSSTRKHCALFINTNLNKWLLCRFVYLEIFSPCEYTEE